MKKPLHILVTRPSPQGNQLTELIEKNGDEAIFLPTIIFDKPADKPDLSQLHQQNWLVFISPQAVKAAMGFIDKLPAHARLAAVGEGTAKVLADYGYHEVLYPETIYNSESLLALPEFQQIENQNIMLVRGDAGRELLAQTFLERQAKVSHLVVYSRKQPTTDVTPVLKTLQSKPLNAIVCTSFEGLKNLKEMLGDVGWPLIKAVPLIVMSERIKTLANDLGFRTIWVSHFGNNDALMAFIDKKRDELCLTTQKKK